MRKTSLIAIVVFSLPAFAGTVTLTPGAQGTYPGTVLADGTTQVDGRVTTSNGLNRNDFFEFEGLPGGVSFSSIGLEIEATSIRGFDVTLIADTPSPDTAIVAATGVPGNTTFTPAGNVPFDGNLIVEITPGSEPAATYTILVYASAPEPATLAVVAIGLAGIAGLRRRRRKNI